MKISEMTADQAADALLRLSEPVSNILDDEEVEPLLKEIAGSEKRPPIKTIASLLPRVVPLALKKHRTDLYEVVGVLAQKPTEEVGSMTVLQIMTVLRNSVDKDLQDFFRSTSRPTLQVVTE